MDDLKYLFGEPEKIDGINVYPLRLKNYNDFFNVSSILILSQDMFAEQNIDLFEALFVCWDYFKYENVQELIDNLCLLFELVTHENVTFFYNEKTRFKAFILGNKDSQKFICSSNYQKIRETITKQNLIFYPKIYKDPLVQEWANLVMASRRKKSSNITLEDLITTVKNYNGHTYEQMKEMTIYQLYADFYRIGMFKQFDQNNLFATVNPEKITIQSFAENINMFKSPYDDLFVDSSKLDKLNSISQPTK